MPSTQSSAPTPRYIWASKHQDYSQHSELSHSSREYQYGLIFVAKSAFCLGIRMPSSIRSFRFAHKFSFHVKKSRHLENVDFFHYAFRLSYSVDANVISCLYINTLTTSSFLFIFNTSGRI